MRGTIITSKFQKERKILRKKSIKTIAIASALALTVSAVPAVSIYAANNSSAASVSAQTEQTVKYGKVTAVNGTKITLALGEFEQSAGGGNGQNGEPPAMPEGNGNGNPPDMPSGGEPPVMPDNNGMNGGTPPAMPNDENGNMGGMNGGTPPAKPEGGSGNMNGGTPPEKPDGESGNMGGFTENGKTLTVNIKNEKVLKKNGNSASLSDISEGDILMLVYNSNGKIGEINIMSGGMGSPQGGMQEKGSMELSAKYSINSGNKKITSKTVSVTDGDKSAVLVTDGASLKITDTEITKTGDSSNVDDSNFYALNAAVAVQENSSAAISGGKITTDAEGSNAVFATGENANITISGTKIYTKSNSSRGLDATYGGSITASDVYIKTLGAHCAPVATDRSGGTVNVTSSKLFANGDGSPCIYSTGDITATDCSGKATGSQIAVVEGKNSITLDGCSFVGAGKNGVMLYQSTSGDAAVGTAVFTSKNSTLKTTSSGPMFYITNTDAVINLNSTKLVFTSGVLLDAAGNNTNNWGKVGSNGGNVVLNAENQTLKGDVTCDNISTVEMNLTNKTVFTGAVDSENAGDVTITLDGTSKWNVTADSYVTAIVDEDGDFSNIISNGHTIYYSSSDSRNSALGGKTITLSDGGKLVPVK
ncbi:MAG: hypothetical protein NC452_10935 [Eubacterium sp.]|nr:hypothetical protein [Eubacterium sp.]